MNLSTEMLTLILYLVQQLGIVLGFGAQLTLLITYLIGKRDGAISETEDAVAHGVYRVLWIAIVFIVASGIGIAAMHYFGGEKGIIAEPAFLAKWALITITMILALLMRQGHVWNNALEGLSGGTWTALFLIHIFAPIATLTTLAMLYGEWLLGWLVMWYLLVFAMRGKLFLRKQIAAEISREKKYFPPAISKKIFKAPLPPILQTKPNPVIAPTSTPVTKFTPTMMKTPLVTSEPLPPLPVPIPIPPAPPTPPASVVEEEHEQTEAEKAILDPDQLPGLPAIQVMAKNREDLEKTNRANVITFP